MLRLSKDNSRWWKAMHIAVLAPFLVQSANTSAQTKKPQAAPAQTLQQQADAARERGDIDASVKLYERALARAPSWQEGWWYLGSLQYDANRYAEASRSFVKLVALNDRLGDAWGMLGLSQFEIRDYAQAFQSLNNAERVGLSDPSVGKIVQFHRGLLMNANGDSDGALLVLSSLYMQGVRSENLQVALGLSLLRVPIFPSDLDPARDALVHDAGSLAVLLATKQYEKAELAFHGMLESYPKVQFIHYAYGGMLASQGHDADAEAQFKAETDLNPDSVLPYMEWAFIAMKTKDYEESKRLARRVLELSPKSFLAHYVLGNSLLLSGDPKAALTELDIAKTLSPQSPDVRYSLSRAHARLGESAAAKEEQAQFLALQKKNATDRLELVKRYPAAQSITGIRPTTSQ